MSEFFYLHFADEDSLAVARAPDDPELDKHLANDGWINAWRPPKLELDDGVVVDYLANSFAFRLCSDRLRDILAAQRAELDHIQWLPTIVADRAGRELSYSILHFPGVPEVLNAAKSVMAGSMIVKAHLDLNLANGHRIFSFPQETLRLVVDSEIKAAIRNAGLTGMTFSRVPAT